MACESGTPSSPLFGCCPTVEPFIVGRSWLAAYTIGAWATPMSCTQAEAGGDICATGFYATKTAEYYSYSNFDLNQKVLMGTATSTLSLPGGQVTTTFSGSPGVFGGEGASITKLMSESATSLEFAAFRGHPDAEASAVNGLRVTLSNPFNPDDYFLAVHGAIQSKFGEPWDPEGQMNTGGPGPVPAMDWLAYYSRDNTLVCGAFADIALERGLSDFNFFIPTEHVCGMDAYSFKEANVSMYEAGAVSFGGGGRRFTMNPVSYYNRVWRRVEWAWGGPGAGPFFEWERDNVSIWAPDGCTVVRPICQRPLGTRCIRLPASGRILREPPLIANSYGRTVRGNCQ